MIADHKGEIPFVILLLPFMAGIGLAVSWPGLNSQTLLFILLICLSIAFISLNISYISLKLYQHAWIGGTLIHAVLLCAGWLCGLHSTDLNDEAHFSKHPAQQLVVKIADEPSVKNGYVRFTAVVQQNINNKRSLSSNGKLLVSIKDSAAFALNYGDVLLIPAKYSVIDPPFNPAEFNYKQYLAHQNINQQAFLYPRQYVILNQNEGNALIAYALNLRKNMVAKIKAGMHDTAAIAIASTLILGYKAELGEDIRQTYTATGTLHVLSVSGAHVALVYLLLGWMLSFLNRFKYGKLLKAIIIIALIWGYALLTGFSPAVCRAAAMISMVITGSTFYRYINILNLLAASAFALLLYNPLYLTDVGFQLSYLAVGGLIVFQPLLYKTLKFKSRLADGIWSLCTISIAAQLITFPLSAFYFHQFPVYFLISNLLITIPVMVIMYAGLAYLLLSGVPYISTALAYVLEKSIILMNKGLAFVERLPFASVSKIWLSTFEYLLLYLIILCIFYFLYKPAKQIIWVVLTGMLLLCISVSAKYVKQFNTNSLTFLNLRKHNGIVFKQGNEAVVLTDIAVNDKTFRYAIQPGLDSAGIKTAHIYSFGQDISLSYLKKTGSLINYNQRLLLIADTNLQFKYPVKPLNTDYLYITGNPYKVLKQINKNLNTGLLVISADNSNTFVDTLTKQLSATQKKYYVLKRNKSLNLVSN